MNQEKHIVSILRDIAEQKGIEFQSLSQDWIIRLSKQRTRWIFGYDFDLNSCCAQQMCKDKAAASLSMALAEVPHIEHVLFCSPQNRLFVPESGTWSEIHSYARRFEFDVVCKPNDGSGGMEVMRTTSVTELEDVVHRLFLRSRAIALSPYVQIQNEYRTIVLNGKCLLTYRKVRPGVIGDGKASRMELIARQLKSVADGITASEMLAELARQKCDLNVIVADGETWDVNWKHNLGLGARIELLGPASAIAPALEKLAIDAAGALNLNFGSVDIVAVDRDKALKILELNSGVMMESLVSLLPEGRNMAAAIYGAALDAMFA